MSEQLPLGPIYNIDPDSSYWSAVDSAAQRTEDDYAEPLPQDSGRDMARMRRRGPDAATVLRGLPAALRGDVPVEHVSSFVLAPKTATTPRTAAEAIIRMAQGPSQPPRQSEGHVI